MTDTATSFEKKVLSAFTELNIDIKDLSENSPLGLAVSGGADSISLLISLNEIFSNRLLRVITVDHGIRSDEESSGDALFVKKICDSLGIVCFVKKVPQGLISQKAESEHLSVEDVARKMRYSFFESFISENNIQFLCLAHNKNDFLETLLMRFLQGSSSEGSRGIAVKKGKYLRPLINISRDEIESYLKCKNQKWRTDATNKDTKYLRNRIRNILVPVLNENFKGWDKALLNGAKKTVCDDDFIREEIDKKILKYKENTADLDCNCQGGIRIERSSFYSLHPALQRRLFFSLLNKAGFGDRFPFTLFEKVSSWNNLTNAELKFENIQIYLDSQYLLIRPFSAPLNSESQILEQGFSFLFKSEDDKAFIGNVEVSVKEYEGKTRVLFKDNSFSQEEISFKVRLPFLIRNACPGDKILSADKSWKNLSDIFSDWKVSDSHRNMIPLVEELNMESENAQAPFLRAVIASFTGYKNWIVQ